MDLIETVDGRYSVNKDFTINVSQKTHSLPKQFGELLEIFLKNLFFKKPNAILIDEANSVQ